MSVCCVHWEPSPQPLLVALTGALNRHGTSVQRDCTSTPNYHLPPDTTPHPSLLPLPYLPPGGPGHTYALFMYNLNVLSCRCCSHSTYLSKTQRDYQNTKLTAELLHVECIGTTQPPPPQPPSS